ncbi:MAG: Uma2 family endonuclease [Bacteroidota bacterium]|nr:Uma2 family endonuclease [Bacteroidota bacterium]
MTKITDISQLDLNKSYTVADYLNWQFDEMVELIKGKIFKMSPAPRNYHQVISSNLIYNLVNITKKTKCKAYHAPFDVYLNGIDKLSNTVVQPDICIVCDPTKIEDRGCVGAPDLIVEIISPSTMKKDLDYKYHLYEENGVREYWIIMPEYKQILVYVLDMETNKYMHVGDFGVEDKVPVHIFDGITLDADFIFNN